MKKTMFYCIIIVFIVSIINTSGQTIFIRKEEIPDTMQPLSSKIITVDDEGDGDFISIQNALNEVNPGDTIYVYSGQYNETLLVNTENIVLEGLNYELGSGNDDDFPDPGLGQPPGLGQNMAAGPAAIGAFEVGNGAKGTRRGAAITNF